HLFGSIGPGGKRPLSEVLSDLRALGPAAAAALPRLFALYEKGKQYEIAAAIRAVGGHSDCLPQIRLYLRHPEALVRQTAFAALEAMGEGGVADLVRIAEELVAPPSVEAARALARLGPKAKAALPALRRLRDDAEGELQRAIDDAVVRIGR